MPRTTALAAIAACGFGMALTIGGPAAARASANTAVPNPPPGVSRIAGTDRYGTGVLVSQSQWADAGGDGSGRPQAQAVVLARGDNYPDALSGVPLAAKVGGPLLLTASTTLTPATATEIGRVLGPGHGQPVYILGGTGAVSAGIADQLSRDGYSVTRYFGADRYGTALDVARRGLGDPAHVIVATGGGYADALAAGPFAAGPDAVGGAPAAIVLSAGAKLDPNTAAYLVGKFQPDGGDCAAVTAVGGQAAAAVAATVPPGMCSTSYSGADRYATAVDVAQLFGPVHAVGVATGGGFADALTGGAAMALLGQPLVLTDPSVLGESARQYLVGAHAGGQASTEIFGGLTAVGHVVEDQLDNIAGGGQGFSGFCGAPANPYDLNYCGRGVTITKAQVPSDICSYFSCIGASSGHTTFWEGAGYLTLCNDGDISLSGGIGGACSSHDGEDHPVWQG